MGKAIAKFSSAGGSTGTGQSVTIWLNGPSAPGWCGSFAGGVPIQSVYAADASTLAQSDPNYHARWQDSDGNEHAVINVTVNGVVISLCLQGSALDQIYAPIKSDEEWTATVDAGQVPQNGSPSSNAVVSAPFDVPTPSTPAATAASEAWIDQIIVNTASKKWGWGNLFTTLPFGDPDFHGGRWTIQNGHYTTPGDPRTFVPGGATSQHAGAEVSLDALPVFRMPGTDVVSVQNNDPASMFPIPDYTLPDGTRNPDDIWRLKNYVASAVSIVNKSGHGIPVIHGQTWTQQNDWSSAVGNSTPGTAAYLDIVIDLSQGVVNVHNIPLASPMVVINNQATIAAAGILAQHMAQAAVSYANQALAANAVVDSNVAAVSIGKLISGTTVLGSMTFSAGSGAPVVVMNNAGLYLYGYGIAAGSGATPGTPNTSTYSAAGLTGYGYVAIQSTGIGVYGPFAAGVQPCVQVLGGGMFLWSNVGQSNSPYAFLGPNNLSFYSGTNGVYTQLNSSGLAVYAGSYSLQAYATGLTLAYSGGASLSITNSSVLISGASLTGAYLSITSAQVTVSNWGGSSNTYITGGQVQCVGPAGYYTNVLAGGIQIVWGSSSISLYGSYGGNTTASAGSLSPPSLVAGYLYIIVNGVGYKIPYYNN